LKNGRTGEKVETADILEIIFPYNDFVKICLLEKKGNTKAVILHGSAGQCE